MAAGAGLLFRESIENFTGNALSILNVCKNIFDQSRDVDNIMRTQNTVVKKLEGVQNRNHKKLFLLGNKVRGTQENFRKLEEVVGLRFKQMESYHVNATLFLARPCIACDHVIVRYMHLSQAIRKYMYEKGTLHTHLKAYRGVGFFHPTRSHSSQQPHYLLVDISRNSSSYTNNLPRLSRS